MINIFNIAYQCPWCLKDLKGKEIPTLAKSYYPVEDTHFTDAIELFNCRGFECPECKCKWDLNEKIFKNGKEELKDKYKIKEFKETFSKESTEDIENNINNLNSEEEINHEQENN